MPRLKDQAICIRLLDWSETSQVVVLLTEEHGKMSGLAKGSRRSSPSSVARFSGGFDLLTRGEVVATIRPSSALATLTEWNLQEPYWPLRRDLQAQRLGFYGADLINAMLAEHDPHPPCFAALAALLESLAQPGDHWAALLTFQWSVLSDCGYQPEVLRDLGSGEEVAQDEQLLFDPQLGGVITAAGGRVESEAGPWRVRRQTVDLLQQLTRNMGGPGGLLTSPIDAATCARANRLLCAYARAILDRHLPTMDFVLSAS